MTGLLIGYLVDLVYMHFETVFQSISSQLSETERKKIAIDEKKTLPNNPTCTY